MQHTQGSGKNRTKRRENKASWKGGQDTKHQHKQPQTYKQVHRHTKEPEFREQVDLTLGENLSSYGDYKP